VRGRDHVVAIRVCGNGLLLETLRYAEEIRASDRIFSAIPETEIEPEMLDLAEELIERKSAPFDPEAFQSQYADALRELIDKKRDTGHVATASDEPLSGRGGNVIDLMEALKKSVAGGGRGGRSPGKKSAGKKANARGSNSRKSSDKKSSGSKSGSGRKTAAG
jgi:DNA end-binding protein Ku